MKGQPTKATVFRFLGSPHEGPISMGLGQAMRRNDFGSVSQLLGGLARTAGPDFANFRLGSLAAEAFGAQDKAVEPFFCRIFSISKDSHEQPTSFQVVFC